LLGSKWAKNNSSNVMWYVFKRSPAIILAVLFPSVFLFFFRTIISDSWKKKIAPIARYCRWRLLRQQDIQTIVSTQYTDDAVDVSIIIPNFNYNNFIPKAIHSAFNTADHALNEGITTEVIVVDDNSDDGSRATIESIIKARSKPAKAIFLKSNCGLSNARNTGMQASNGELLLFLDSDNWLNDNAVTSLCASMKDKKAAASYGKIQTWHLKSGKKGVVFSDQPYNLERLLTRGNYIDAMAMYRKKTLVSLGGFSTRLQLFSWCYEDYELWVRIGTYGHSVINIPDIIGEYLFKEDSLITKARGDKAFTTKLIRLQARSRMLFRKFK